MRRVLKLSLASAIVAATMVPLAAQAQMPQQRPGQQDRPGQQGTMDGAESAPRPPRIAPLRRNAAAGPCPYVKILYDAARYVEMTGDRPAAANVGFTGEIEGLTSNCSYQADQPITVDASILFNLGRGPQAQTDGRTYRYWIAVTERNRAVFEKTYFDLPVAFEGGDRTSVTEEQRIVIPRAETTTSGDNFEILIGFDVTPEMAQFNRDGSRFRINAGTAAPTAPTTQPSAE